MHITLGIRRSPSLKWLVHVMMTSLPQFNGLRPQTGPVVSPVKSLVAVQPIKRRGQGALGARCDFIGSPTNLIMVTATSLMLFAVRFGLAPSANRKATAGLKLEVRESGLQTGDPAGFTLADTLACGVVGHIIGVGIVLGLKGISSL
ncbi:photosystem I reaction center subunit psaK, chloroplastic-like [Primulina tabacum]|uniref:photosystem I reaction center subunit psaK, chloroplastic-like n=1 Tax=Primulina tabacum TaxID=48773 RepID=UPI003F594869